MLLHKDKKGSYSNITTEASTQQRWKSIRYFKLLCTMGNVNLLCVPKVDTENITTEVDILCMVEMENITTEASTQQRVSATSSYCIQCTGKQTLELLN